jgi:hypothetical protein
MATVNDEGTPRVRQRRRQVYAHVIGLANALGISVEEVLGEASRLAELVEALGVDGLEEHLAGEAGISVEALRAEVYHAPSDERST